MTILTAEQIEALPVDQAAYDNVSLNRRSTFINLFDTEGEFIVSVNSLDMKNGSDFLFLAEVLRAAELSGKIELNSLAAYKGLIFRLAAVQTTELNSPLKRNLARREDFQKKSAPQAPVQAQNTAIQQQNVF